MRGSLGGLLIGCSLLFGCCLSGCRSAEEDTVFPFPEEALHEGDLVFRRGRGVTSRVVLAADEYSVYSHAGIVTRDSGGWRVVHAVPGEGGGDRVKMEPLSTFFLPERAVKGAVMRVTGAGAEGDGAGGAGGAGAATAEGDGAGDFAGVAERAARRAAGLYRRGILFDHNYNLEDTTKMYCTELIHNVFLHEGLDLTGGRRTRIDLPGFRGDYILPGDLHGSVLLELIAEF